MPVTDAKNVKTLGTILCVGAHPDDETFMAGGLFAIARQNGQRVICVTATKGEGGSQDLSKWPAATMGQIRSEELAAALKVLDVTEHHWLGYTDGECAKVEIVQAVQQLTDIMGIAKPDTIITFGPDGLTGHPDHQAVSQWVSAAVADSALKPTVLHAVIDPEQFKRYFKPVHDKLNWFFNIASPPLRQAEECSVRVQNSNEVCLQKLAAFRAMPSQYEAMFAAFDEPFLTELFRIEAFVTAKT